MVDRVACCVLLCAQVQQAKTRPCQGLACLTDLPQWELWLEGSLGMTAFLCECSSLCSQALGESKASVPWCWCLRSSKISTLDVNMSSPFTIQMCYGHSTLLGQVLGAVSQLWHCFVDLIHVQCKGGYFAASLASTLKIPGPWHTEKSPKIVRCLENWASPSKHWVLSIQETQSPRGFRMTIKCH